MIYNWPFLSSKSLYTHECLGVCIHVSLVIVQYSEAYLYKFCVLIRFLTSKAALSTYS